MPKLELVPSVVDDRYRIACYDAARAALVAAGGAA